MSFLDEEADGEPTITWEMLDMLAEDWNILAWRARLSDRWQVDLEDLDAALSYEGWDGRRAVCLRSSAFLAGFATALEDARSAVTQGSTG